MVFEKWADCEAGKKKVFWLLVFLEMKTYTVARGQKQTSAFVALVLQLPHTNQISHFQGFKETKHKI